MKKLAFTLVGMTLWLAASPLSSRATPPQQKQTIRPSATIQDSTIRLLPSGASFKIPQAWLNWNRSNGGNLFLSPEELEKAKIGVGEWNGQFAQVVNATLPFEKCSAQAGGVTWENSPGVAVQMRAYIGEWSVDAVRRQVIGAGVTAVLSLDKNVSKVSFERTVQNKWQVSTLTFYLSFGDYGGTARIDFYAQAFGKQTAVLVFMSIEGDSKGNTEIKKIANSFSWKP